jgi:hypothetical protein
MKLYVLSEHYGWAEEHSFEAAVLLVTDSRPQAEELAQQRIERPFDDDPPPSTWFLELTEMEAGVPLTGREPRVVFNKRGERADHPESLDVSPRGLTDR